MSESSLHSAPQSSSDHGSAHAPHAEGGHHDMHLKLYWTIGGILMFLTFVTVLLSFIDFGSHTRNIVVAMIVASGKVGLVGAIFMHLKGERPTIWRFLYFTVFFFAGLFLLTLLAWGNPVFGTQHNLH